jgi:hypothetical protein
MNIFGEFACSIFIVDSVLKMEAVCSKNYWYISVMQFTFCETVILNFTAVRTSDLVKEKIIVCHKFLYKLG